MTGKKKRVKKDGRKENKARINGRKKEEERKKRKMDSRREDCS